VQKAGSVIEYPASADFFAKNNNIGKKIRRKIVPTITNGHQDGIGIESKNMLRGKIIITREMWMLCTLNQPDVNQQVRH